ncbi:MAG: WYL domain-containing transcriptional regulator [Ignavibacteria bacterium]|nr:WYL domain-containing transcriptional regulator [Ignavibacteria bacterium]
MRSKKSLINKDTLRLIEITALILESQGEYSELDLCKYFNGISSQTIRRDANILRSIGVQIHSSKGKYYIYKIPDDVLNNFVNVYLSYNKYETIKAIKLLKKKFGDKTLSIIVKLVKSINNREIIILEYKKTESKEIILKNILPISLIRTARNIYLLGIENDENNIIKIFSFDKIHGIEFTNRKIRVADIPDLTEYFKTVWGIYVSEKISKVVIEFSKDVGENIKDNIYIETQKIYAYKDKYIMEMNVRISNELISWIMGWGGEAKVLEPQELIDLIKIKAEKILENYRLN